MSFPIQSDPNLKSDSPAPTKIIQSRSQYHPCHIRVPDLERPVPAIRVGREYYSFFKAVQSAEKTLKITAKLGNLGEDTVITQTPKAYIVWVKEPDASPC